MREILADTLWLSNAVEIRNMRRVLSFGVEVIVDLAADEPVLHNIPRDVAYLRFPLNDGGGNDPAILCAAVDAVARFIRCGKPIVVFCSAGLSRSPCVSAAAIAKARGLDPHNALEQVVRDKPSDVSALLWQAIVDSCF